MDRGVRKARVWTTYKTFCCFIHDVLIINTNSVSGKFDVFLRNNNRVYFCWFSNAAHIVPEYSPFHFYSATKHAVKALTEGLRQELKNINSPIRVTVRDIFVLIF